MNVDKEIAIDMIGENGIDDVLFDNVIDYANELWDIHIAKSLPF